MIDGARIVSPGVLDFAQKAFSIYPASVVTTLAYHIGTELQHILISKGYTKEQERVLLANSNWKLNGYNLFSISTLAASSKQGWFKPLAESNCIFLSKNQFNRLGGFDENFVSAGGGLVNLDFYQRACDFCETNVVLLGEGSFHQMHGGIATNSSSGDELSAKVSLWLNEYKQIRGSDFSFRSAKQTVYFGSIAPQSAQFLYESSLRLVE